jgi:DNA-binding NarL/FixJ family response regulator
VPIPIIKVLLVNDKDLVSQNQGGLLEGTGDITVVGQANDGWEAAEMIRQYHPNVILLSIGSLCTGELKAITRKILSASPRVKIIVVHRNNQKHLALEALRNGAMGHLGQEKVTPSELVSTIRKVNRGEVVLSPGMAGAILDEVIGRQDEKR